MDKFDDQNDLDAIRNRSLKVMNLVIFMDMFAVSLVVPLLPYYAKKVGMSNQTYGVLGTAFGVCQLIAGPIIGKYADQYGRKLFIYLSIIASMFSYFLVGLSNTALVLIFSRVVIGLLKQTNTIANAYISDVTTNTKRTAELSYMRSVIGFAFMLGPTIGGYLSAYDMYIPAFLASFIFLLELIVSYCFLVPPESIKIGATESIQMSTIQPSKNGLSIEDPSTATTEGVKRKNAKTENQQEKESENNSNNNSNNSINSNNLNNLNSINTNTTNNSNETDERDKVSLPPISFGVDPKKTDDIADMGSDSVGQSRVYYILFLHLLSSFASVSFIESFSIFSRDHLKLTPKLNGFMWTYISCLSTLTQRFAVSRAISFFGELQLLIYSSALLGFSVFFYSYTTSFVVILSLLVPIQICRGIIETTVISMATKSTKKFGTVLGFVDSVGSIARSLTPTIVGFLLAGGQHYPMVFSSFSSACFVFFLWTSFGKIV